MIVSLPDLLDAAALRSVRQTLSTAVWRDGKSSAQGRAQDIKHNWIAPVDDPASRAAAQPVFARLSQHEAFKAATLPKVIMPLTFCRYDEGMGYGQHLDLPLMGTKSGAMRTDISATVFLSDASEYEGGDLVFDTDYGTHRVSGSAGEVVLYPAGTLHRVEPVTRGSRLVAITWIQSQVREPERRKVIFDLAQIATALDVSGREEAQVLRLRQTQFNLLRLWADP